MKSIKARIFTSIGFTFLFLLAFSYVVVVGAEGAGYYVPDSRVATNMYWAIGVSVVSGLVIFFLTSLIPTED